MPMTRRTTNWRTGTRRTGTRGRGITTAIRSFTPTSYNPMRFTPARREVTAKIQSFRNIHEQFTGTNKVTAFSPSAVNKWINFINSGSYIYKFTNTQFCRFFGTRFNRSAPTAAYKYLRTRFGGAIKGVTRGKGNTWLVAATPRVSARPFSSYTWK